MGEKTPTPTDPGRTATPTPASAKPTGWTAFWQKKMVSDAKNDENVAANAIDLLAKQNSRLLDMQESDGKWKRAVVTVVVFAFLLIVAAGIGLGTGTLKLPGGGELKTQPANTAP